MNNNIATEIFSKVDSYLIMFIYLGMILIYVTRYIKKDSVYTKTLILAGKLMLFNTILSIFNVSINSFTNELNLNIYFIVYSISLAVSGIVILLEILFYFGYVIEEKEENLKILIKVVKAIVLVDIILLVINFFANNMFSLSSSGKIIKEGMYILNFIGQEFLVIYALIRFITLSKSKKSKNKIFITAGALLIAIISIVEVISSANTLINTFNLFSIGLMLIHIKFDQKTIQQTTGIDNMQCFIEFIKQKIKEGKDEYIVVLLDLDGINDINEKYNYSEGDFSIRQTAQIAKNKIKAPNYVASSDSDEIIIYYDNLKEEEVEEEMFKLSNEINALNVNSSKPYSISFTHVIQKCTKEIYKHPNDIIQDLFYNISKIKIEKNKKV